MAGCLFEGVLQEQAPHLNQQRAVRGNRGSFRDEEKEMEEGRKRTCVDHEDDNKALYEQHDFSGWCCGSRIRALAPRLQGRRCKGMVRWTSSKSQSSFKPNVPLFRSQDSTQITNDTTQDVRLASLLQEFSMLSQVQLHPFLGNFHHQECNALAYQLPPLPCSTHSVPILLLL